MEMLETPAIQRVLEGLRQSLSTWKWPAVLQREWCPMNQEKDMTASAITGRIRVLSFNLLADCKQKEEGWWLYCMKTDTYVFHGSKSVPFSEMIRLKRNFEH